MTYDEYTARYGRKDHILIRMTDSFPFFKEKRIIENGVQRIETNYHIANGMNSCYINYEISHGSLAAEVSWYPRFDKISGIDCPILITNVGTEEFEVDLHSIEVPKKIYEPVARVGTLHPNEVFAIYPFDEAIATFRIFDEIGLKEYAEKKGLKLGQDEINRLLGGSE